MWIRSSSSDRRALDIVDGAGIWQGYGPHYSRRAPGSKTFTGVGREIVLVTAELDAVWAVVLQKTPAKRGSGKSRGRLGEADPNVRYLWRNMLFRNLGKTRSSDLIKSALAATYSHWLDRYGELPGVRLRTEIGINAVRSRNAGYCYKCAGWGEGRVVRGKLYLYAPILGNKNTTNQHERTGTMTRQPSLPTMARPTIKAIDEKCAVHQKAKAAAAKADAKVKAAAADVSETLMENLKKLEKDSDKNHCYVYDDGADGVEYVIPYVGTMRTRKPTKPKDESGSID